MRVLVTGSLGRIGQFVAPALAETGHEIRSFDAAAARPGEVEHVPGDVRDLTQVRRAMMGCDAVVHLAAIPNDQRGHGELIIQTNVGGTWNVLQAASEAGISRVVYFSSVQAIGMGGWGKPEFRPEYLPVDEAHPARPKPHYGLSKLMGEEMCQSFTAQHGFSTYCLRPTFVVVDPQPSRWMDPANPWQRQRMALDLYAYVDVRDVASAVVCCLAREDEGFHGRYFLSGPSNILQEDTRELYCSAFPDVPWKAGPDYLDPPDRSLINTTAAREDLGWVPRLRWPRPEESQEEL